MPQPPENQLCPSPTLYPAGNVYPGVAAAVVVPVHVTGTDRATTSIAAADSPNASVTGSDRPTTTVMSG